MTALCRLALVVLLIAITSVASAQTYKCDWSVNGIGGGDMAGSAYKCGSTAGQTAVGQMTGTSYWAFIGFWQPQAQAGVREQTYLPIGSFVTHLYSPFPTPAVRSVTIRYSLAAEGLVTLRVHDLTGRVVRTLCASSMKRGEHSITWNGTDDCGRELARGVCFCRFTAGDYRATEKLVLQR
jgi:hypothetical protein